MIVHHAQHHVVVPLIVWVAAQFGEGQEQNRHRQTHPGRRHVGTDTNIELASVKAVLSAVIRRCALIISWTICRSQQSTDLRESSKASKTKVDGAAMVTPQRLSCLGHFTERGSSYGSSKTRRFDCQPNSIIAHGPTAAKKQNE